MNSSTQTSLTTANISRMHTSTPAPHQVAEYLGQLNQIICRAQNNQALQQLPANQLLYHCGIYDNHTGLWSTTPDVKPCPSELNHSLNFRICAHPKETLQLIEIAAADFQAHSAMQLHNEMRATAHFICELLEQHSLGLQADGLITQALCHEGKSYNIILFSPLNQLQLFDIEPYPRT